MNNDTIYRQAAIDALDEYIEEYSFDLDENGYHNPKWCAMQEAKMTIQRLPSAVRHGRWIKTGVLYRDTRGLFYGKRCSVCNELSDCKPHYCPICGARMEVE